MPHEKPPHPAGDHSSHRLTLTGLRRRRGWELHPGVRSTERLSAAERAADQARDVIGSWRFAITVGGLMTVGIVAAVSHDHAGPVAVAGLVLSALVVLGLSVVLMAGARADRVAAELALHQRESERRAAAVVAELRDEVEQLRGDVAHLRARLEASATRTRAEAPR